MYLGNVFVRFFPFLLDLTLNSNDPHCTRPSCLFDWKQKRKLYKTKAIENLAINLKRQGQTNNQHGICCSQKVVQNSTEVSFIHDVHLNVFWPAG